MPRLIVNHLKCSRDKQKSIREFLRSVLVFRLKQFMFCNVPEVPLCVCWGQDGKNLFPIHIGRGSLFANNSEMTGLKILQKRPLSWRGSLCTTGSASPWSRSVLCIWQCLPDNDWSWHQFASVCFASRPGTFSMSYYYFPDAASYPKTSFSLLSSLVCLNSAQIRFKSSFWAEKLSYLGINLYLNECLWVKWKLIRHCIIAYNDCPYDKHSRIYSGHGTGYGRPQESDHRFTIHL